MILTLTLNPAVDVSLTTDRIIYDDRSYIHTETYQAGGKGINAARAILDFGWSDVEALAPFGGVMGERFARLVRESGLPVTLVPVQGETRRNIAIVDDEGLTIKLDQRGNPLSTRELDAIEQRLREKLPDVRWLCLNGSVPPGVPDDYYANLIRLARDHGVRTLIDTSGAALAPALAAGPTLAKPNRPEAERLLGRGLLGERAALTAAQEILARGPEHVILSLGGHGAIGVWGERRIHAIPPEIESGSPIGAGDVLGAVTVGALRRGDSFEDAFLWGVAAATVAASLPGLGTGPMVEVAKMRERIEVLEL
ncbi:MAG: 1-phosphofructokinase family hexose kinase [Bryobacterales bacterium]